MDGYRLVRPGLDFGLNWLTAILLRLLDGRVSLTSSTLGSGDGQTSTRMSWSKSSIASTLSTWKPTRCAWIPTITSESSVLASTWRDFLYRSVHAHLGNSGSTHSRQLSSRQNRKKKYLFLLLSVSYYQVGHQSGRPEPASPRWQNKDFLAE